MPSCSTRRTSAFPCSGSALGETQLHVFERDAEPQSHHHFAITVEDLEPVYRRAEALGAFDRDSLRQPHHRVPRRRRPDLRARPRGQPDGDRHARRGRGFPRRCGAQMKRLDELLPAGRAATSAGACYVKDPAPQ